MFLNLNFLIIQLRINNGWLVQGALTLNPDWSGVRVHPEGIHPEGNPRPTLVFAITSANLNSISDVGSQAKA